MINSLSTNFKTKSIKTGEGAAFIRLIAFVLISLVILFPEQSKILLVSAAQYQEFALVKILFVGLVLLAGQKLFWWV